MKHHKKWLLGLFLIWLLVFPSSVFAADTATQPDSKSDKTFMWKAEGKGTVYMLGSIHLCKADMYPLDARIENAFKESQILALEVNPLAIDQLKVMKIIMNKGMYKGTETLKDNLSKEDFEMLRKHCEENSLSIQDMMKFKPCMVSLMLPTMELMKMGYRQDLGIDHYFAKKTTGSKKIVELESLDQQLSLIFDMPEQEGLLKYTVADMSNLGKNIDAIVKAWKAGDATAMEKIISKPLTEKNAKEIKPVFKKLFDDRNIKMAEKIKGFLKTGNTYFVVVGAGHLVGKKGVIQLLKTEGIKVGQK